MVAERVEETVRRVVREELNDVVNELDLGLPGSDRRRQWLYFQRRLEEQIKRQDAAKDRRISSVAGICYGVVSTLLGLVIAKFSGGVDWLLSFFMVRH